MGLLDKLLGRSKDVVDRVGDTAGAAADKVGLDDAAEKVGDIAGDVADKVGDVAGGAVDKAKDITGIGDDQGDQSPTQ